MTKWKLGVVVLIVFVGGVLVGALATKGTQRTASRSGAAGDLATEVASTDVDVPPGPTATDPTLAPTTTATPRDICNGRDLEYAGSASSPADVLELSLTDDLISDFGDLSRSDVEKAFGRPIKYFADGGGSLSIVRDDLGSLSFRQRYVPGETGSPVVEFLGNEPLLDESRELWLSYRVKFEPGWEFVQGGKLPGLAGGRYASGGSGADGSDGFSARLMWRPDQKLVVYAYHPDRPTRFGEDFPLCGNVPVGAWFSVTQHVVLNSGPDAFDGVVEVWIDGEKRQSRSDVRWRIDGSFGVDQFVYSSFYGGDTSDWSPSTTTYAQFGAFKVATSASGVDFGLS